MAIMIPHNVKSANTNKRAQAFISGAGELSRAPALNIEGERPKVVVNMRFDKEQPKWL